jgi:WD40 repeat protein/serine/threonine protein kinase
MTDNDKQASTRDDHFASVLAKILQEEEAGKPVDLSRVVRKNPELETRLREYFRDRDRFDQLANHIAPPTDADESSDLARGSMFAGYEIIRELGRGGMGIVYLARQKSANRLVALKVIRMDCLDHLRPRQREKWLIRFRKEGQAHARIADEGVVPVYEVGAHEGRPFFSMQYVAGRSLAAILAAKPLKNRAAASLIRQVARALQAIHDHGVLHRDVKPHNILVEGRDRAFISDFGLAKWMDAADCVTHTGEMLGTPHYMSPEQVQNAAHATEASDIYGLGATLYAVLTGKPPFPGTTVSEILYQVRFREPVSPRRLNPAIDRDLETIVLKCLEKEPKRRFASAKEVANELKRYLDGRPIRTRPLGPAGRLWRWSRRNPALAAVSVAAVVLVALAGTLFPAYWLATRRADDADLLAGKNKEGLTKATGQLTRVAYLDDMGLAQKHVNEGELTKARELLAKWRPEEGAPDLRAWEWFLLDSQCREAVFFKRGHTVQVQAVAWSPKGERLASADRQGNIKVWRLADDGNQPVFDNNAKGSVVSLAWSPDDKRLATACEGMVQIWAVDSGKEEATLPITVTDKFLGPPGTGVDAWTQQILSDTWIASLTWSPNGRNLALVSANGKVHIWDVTRQKDDPLVGEHAGGVHSAAWSPDGNQLASVGGDGVVKVWDLANGKPRDLTPPIPARDIITTPQASYALVWADKGKHLNLVSGDGTIRVLDANSGAEVAARRLESRDELVRSGITGTGARRFVWCPTGQLLASVDARVTSGSSDVTIWDAATGKELLRMPSAWSVAKPGVLVKGQNATGCSPAWDSSGQRLALGGDDGMVKSWNISSGRRAVRAPILNSFSKGMAWSWDNQSIMWASEYAFEDVPPREKPNRAPPGGIGPPPEGPAIPPDPPRPDQGNAALPHFPGPPNMKARPQILVCNGVTGNVMRKRDTKVKLDMLVESPNRKWLAAATVTGLLQLWPANEGEQPITLQEPKNGMPAVGAATNTVVLGGQLLAWSPDGKLLAYSVPSQSTIDLWDPETKKIVQTLKGHEKPLRTLVWCPDGERMATASNDGTVRIWNVASGKEAIHPIKYFVDQEPPKFGFSTTYVCSMLGWSSDAKLLAVAGEDEAVRIWDLSEQKEVRSLLLHGSNQPETQRQKVCSVAWSPDGKRLVCANPDGTFGLWETASWREVLALKSDASGSVAQALMPSFVGTLAWSPDSRQLAFFSAVGSVTIWDATPKEEANHR